MCMRGAKAGYVDSLIQLIPVTKAEPASSPYNHATLKPRRRSFRESTDPLRPPTHTPSTPSPCTIILHRKPHPSPPPQHPPESRRRRAMGELQAQRSAAETRLGPNRINSQPAQVEPPPLPLQTHTRHLTHNRTHTYTNTHAREHEQSCTRSQMQLYTV